MIKLLRGIVQGVALFLGAFSAVNIFVSQLGSARAEDIWWIDASVLPSPVAGGLAVAAAVLLVAFAAKPKMSAARSIATIAVSLSYVALAFYNGSEFYRALSAGTFDPTIPVPFSAVVSLLFLLVAVSSWAMRSSRSSIPEHFVTITVAVVALVAFPVAQMYFFGTTSYRAPADAVVVFGARVYPDGTLSTTVKDRMDTAIDLYDEGLAPVIVITGGVDEDGVDETEHMRGYAIAAGVAPAAIIVDNQGSNTDRSAANTVAIFREIGAERVLAVSQFYHLPRIKMAYRALRFSVRTVPAGTSQPIPGTPSFMAREVPAFWVYWLRSGVRDLREAQIF